MKKCQMAGISHRKFTPQLSHKIRSNNIIVKSVTFFQNLRTKITKAERRDKCRTKFCD